MPASLSPALPLFLSLLLAMLLSSAVAADFPPVDQLPARPEFPDPLVMLDGTRVTTKEQWESKRKPELKALFQHYMYGRLPPAPTRQTYSELFRDEKALGGKATLSEVRITFEQPSLSHPIHVLFAVPNNVTKPPVFVGMNFCGNHTLLDDPRIHLPEVWCRNTCPGVVNERATDKGRGGQQDLWNIDLIIDRGYALACFYSGDVDPDTPDMNDGIGPAFYQPGQSTAASDDAGTIMLWAWGFHRVVDYVERGAGGAVDPNRIAVVGHSRNGKTALLAGAFDERIAVTIPLQSGCGGAAPSRTTDTRAESVRQINTSFPHWFDGNFKRFQDPLPSPSDANGKTVAPRREIINQFSQNTNRLPFDQHCLIALCAPRPVLLPNAEEDLWANPNGQLEMLKLATPVYRLLGSPGLADGATPAINKLINSPLGYFLRPGKHAMTRPDWEIFLTYCDQHLKAATSGRPDKAATSGRPDKAATSGRPDKAATGGRGK
ncbi:MAG: acetylxylan esterase [Planctomycetia bacterium]|nr:acetylxylan esterase [Planctomycetia bacterium]